MPYRIFPLLLISLLALSACNLRQEPDVQETPTTAATGKPSVSITAPRSGDEFVVEEDILISATATDSAGVTRVQLLANGQVVKTVSSESASGDTTMNVLLDYVPPRAGEIDLEVIAYRSAVASDPASITIDVRASQAQVTSTPLPQPNVPVIDPNDPTCRALTNTGLNFRNGPGTNYGRITVLQAGTVVPIIGRLGSNEWWQVRYNNQLGWVSAAYTAVYGICTGVPVAQPPPSPTGDNPPTSTPAPTFTPQPTNTAQPTATPANADLVAGTVRGPQTVTIPSGESEITEEYSVTITNTGGQPTGQFANVIILEPDNTVIPLSTVANLNAGESINLSVEVTFVTEGRNTLRVRVDDNNNVDEQFESNNENTYQVDVIAE